MNTKRMPTPCVQPLLMLPNGDRGSLVEIVKDLRPLDDLVLAPTTRGLLERVLHERVHVDKLTAKGLRPIHRVLFCGPPGCGKTVAAGGIALAMGLPMASVRLDAVIGQYMGTTAAHLRQVFNIANSQRAVLFFDEIDGIGRSRSQINDDNGEAKRVVNSLLVMLEEVPATSLVIAATNYESALDPALWRRFDEIVVFPPPTAADRVLLLNHLLARCDILPRDRRWAQRLAGMSFADVERVAFDAMKTLAIDEHLNIERTLLEAVQRQKARRAVTGGKKR